MFDAYVIFVQSNPLFSAAIQFAILGTLGEMLSHLIIHKKIELPCKIWQLIAKIFAWALLGIIIKYGFAGMKGFTRSLLELKLLPLQFATGIGWAFAVSVLTNLFFGPQMMAFHRLEDNLIEGKLNFAGITTAWWTLVWFWIPAHTVTFLLPTHFQIGLAALWGMVLGLILGLAKQKSKNVLPTVPE